MNWHAAVAEIAPYVVKIETPSGHGSGFLCLYNEERTFCGIATAYHVVRHADYWQQPIRISHELSDEPVFVPEGNRVIFTDAQNDSAVIFFPPGKLKFPKDLMPLLPLKTLVKIGVEVAWLGYPSVSPHTMCFFSGNISARPTRAGETAYFIDGVAINGVSGGPVFHLHEGHPRIIGTISAYYANVATGETLPGLSFAQGVTYFHDTIATIRNLDEARKKQQEQDEGDGAPAPPPPEHQADPPGTATGSPGRF